MLSQYFVKNKKEKEREHMTDEGVKEEPNDILSKSQQVLGRVFDAYPFMSKRPFLWSLACGMFLVFIVFYSFARVAPDIKKPHPPPPAPVKPTIVHLDELYEIRNFTADQLSGFKSGRVESLLIELADENRQLMARANTVCATPWLKFALQAGVERTAGHVFNNILTLASHPDSLLNVFIVSHDNTATTLVSDIPFNIKDTTRHSRVYYDKITVSHTKGLYTTKDKYEAFCIQELY